MAAADGTSASVEAVLEATFESTPVLIAYLDRSFRFVRVNRAYAAADGKSPEDFVGKQHFELYPNPENESLFRRVLETGEGYTARAKPFEYASAPERGVSHWDWTLTPRRASDGQVVGLVLAVSDVTERVRALEAAQSSEEQFRTAFEQAAVGMVLCNLEGRFVRANRRFCEIVGYTSDELAGRSFRDLTYPEDLPGNESLLARLLSGELSEYFMEKRYVRKDGVPVWASLYVSARRQGSAAVHLLGVVQDISEHKAAEVRLRREQAILQRAERLARLGSWEWDLKTQDLRWSDEMYRQFGFSRDELPTPTPAHVAARIHRDDFSKLAQQREEALRQGSYRPIEYRILHPSGETRWVRAEGEVTRGPDGQPERMFGFVLDITEQKQTEERIAAQLREKEVLLQEVHHRVKNNLSIIAAMLNLQANKLGDASARTALLASHGRVHAMALVHEMLYRSGELAHIRFQEHIERLCRQLVSTYETEPGRVRLVSRIDDVVLELGQAIPASLILNELVSNALKYAFPGGREGTIEVALQSRPDGGFCLDVRDTGVGLPAEVEPERVGSLGLRLVVNLAQQLGASLSVERGQGTRFRIDVPSSAVGAEAKG